MIAVGDSISETYVIDADLVSRFGSVVNDLNPLHVDPEIARQSRFGRPIAHGTLIMGFISALLGQRLPGPGSVYVVQHSEYRAPVYVGETVTVTITVVQLFSSGVARLAHEVRVDDRVAVTGYSDVYSTKNATGRGIVRSKSPHERHRPHQQLCQVESEARHPGTHKYQPVRVPNLVDVISSFSLQWN